MQLKRIRFFVMAGLVPAIHVFLAATLLRRGCPGSQTSLRSLRKGRLLCPGMTSSPWVPITGGI
jgi:hypothetical protein